MIYRNCIRLGALRSLYTFCAKKTNVEAKLPSLDSGTCLDKIRYSSENRTINRHLSIIHIEKNSTTCVYHSSLKSKECNPGYLKKIFISTIGLGAGAFFAIDSQISCQEAKQKASDFTFFQPKSTDAQIQTSDLFAKVLSQENAKTIEKDWKDKNFHYEFQKNTEIHNSEILGHRRLLNYKQGSDLFNHDTFEIPGLALITTYLKEKKGVEGLFVCESEDSCIEKIKEIASQQSQTQRCAFIIEKIQRGQKHKICIGVEKKKGKLHLLALDSLGNESSASEYFFSRLRSQCKKENIEFECLISSVRRQFGSSGCSIFALQDALSFLQDPDFFAKINIRPSFLNKDTAYIIHLPPAFMIGMQSISQIARYRENDVQLEKETIPGRKKTLEEYLNQNCIQPRDVSKQQNHYITKKILRYQQIIIGALQTSSGNEIKETIDRSLINRSFKASE